MPNKIYGFFADSYLFYTQIVVENTLVADQFANFSNDYIVARVPDGLDVRTGWNYQDGEFSNPNNLVEYDVNTEEDASRYAFVSTDTGNVFLTYFLDNTSYIGKTFATAYQSGIAIHDITGHGESIQIGAQLVDGNLVPPTES